MKAKVSIETIKEDLEDIGLAVVLLPVKSAWISKAMELALQLNLYAADAHHLAAAILEKADVMVTSDEKHLLTSKVKRVFNVLSPQEYIQEYER